MPAEWEPHEATWMALPTHSWWGGLREQARVEVYEIANRIVEHEPVRLLVRAEDAATVFPKVSAAVQVVVSHFDDCWTRDTAPTFVVNDAGRLGAVCWRFNGWGAKYVLPADIVLNHRLAVMLHAERIRPALTFEGGNICSDGKGTVLVSESACLHPHRNGGMSKARAEEILTEALGASRIVWVPGNRLDHMTDGHIDGIACFVPSGEVLCEMPRSMKHPEYRPLHASRAALVQAGLTVRMLHRPKQLPSSNPDFSSCYVNFYVANGLVLMPGFGDRRADAEALETVRGCFPDRDVVQLRVDAIAEGGGGIHCITQQQPKA